MKYKFAILSLLLFLSLLSISFTVTGAIFNDIATSSNNTFTTAASFSSPTATPSATLSPTPTGDTTLSLTTSTGTVGAGETFTVTIMVDGGIESYNTVLANVTYPSSKIQSFTLLTSAADTDFDFALNSPNPDVPGIVDVLAGNGASGITSGIKKVAKITFTVKPEATGVITLDFGVGSSVVHPSSSTNLLDATFSATRAVSNIVINEVSSDGDSQFEWVELFNPTASSINVSGWKIGDASSDDVIPTVSPIPAGGYGVIVGSTNTTTIIPSGAITIQLGSSSIGAGLNETGDAVYLKYTNNTIIDAMNYGSNVDVFTGGPVAPTLGTQSLIRTPNGTDTDTGIDWVRTNTQSIGVSN